MDSKTFDIRKIRPSEKTYKSTLTVLEYAGHALYVADVERGLAKYVCTKCDMVFAESRKMLNHKKNKCEIQVIERFEKEPRPYRPNVNGMKILLKKYNIKTNFYIDHFIVYDFECILKPIDIKVGKKRCDGTYATEYRSVHIPVSVSICDSLTRKVINIIDDSPKELIRKMFDYLNTVQREIREYNEVKFKKLYNAIEKIKNTDNATWKKI